jgi:hypothetical protein
MFEAERAIEVKRCVNQNWPAVGSCPIPILDIFAPVDNQVSPGLTDRDYFHASSRTAIRFYMREMSKKARERSQPC